MAPDELATMAAKLADQLLDKEPRLSGVVVIPIFETTEGEQQSSPGLLRFRDPTLTPTALVSLVAQLNEALLYSVLKLQDICRGAAELANSLGVTIRERQARQQTNPPEDAP